MTRPVDERSPGPGRAPAPGLPLLVLAGLVVAALLIWPLLGTVSPPLVDFPNLLARAYITRHLDASQLLQRFYIEDWELQPSLGMDAILPALMRLVPVYWAARLAVALTVALWVAVGPALHYALFRKWSLWPLFSALFVYNAPLAWGFVSYLFVTALALLGFALWLYSTDWPSWPRRLLFLAIALLLFLGHLLAFGLFCLLVGAHELGRLFDRGRPVGARAGEAGLNLLVLLPPFLLLLHLSVAPGGSYTAYGGLLRKAEALFSPTLQYLLTVDFPLWAAAVAIFAFGLASGRLRLARPLVLPLAALVLLCLVTPTWFLGVDYVDVRFPFVVFVLLASGTSYRPRLPREGAVLLLVAAVLLAWRAGSVAAAWRVYDRDYRAFIAATPAIARGSRLMVAVGQDRRGDFGDNLHAQTAAFAVIERQVYLPNLFTGVTVLKVRPAYRRIDAAETLPAPIDLLAAEYARSRRGGSGRIAGLPHYLDDWERHFDYLVVFLWHRQRRVDGLPLTLVARGSYFAIYRIEH